MAVSAPDPVGQRLDALMAEQSRARRAHRLEVIGMAALEYGRPDEVCSVIAEEGETHRRRVENRAIGGLSRQHVRRVLGEKPMPLFAFAERELRVFSLGDVAGDGEERGHFPVALLDVHVLANPQLAAVERDRRKFPVGHRDAVSHLPLVERDTLVVIIAPDKLQVDPADDTRLARRKPEEPRRDRICIGEHPARVDPVDAIARALDKVPKARFGLEQRSLHMPCAS